MPIDGDKGESGGDNDESKGLSVGGTRMDKPQEIAHAHTKDPTGILFLDEGDGESGTCVESTGPRGGPSIGIVSGRHGDQPTDTYTGMLHVDALQQAASA